MADGTVYNLRAAEHANSSSRAPSAGLLSSRLGFRGGVSGVHAARTMMFAELERVFEHFESSPVRAIDVRAAIIDNNILGRSTMASRRHVASLLVELYGLDDRFPLFRALRRLWAVDSVARPSLALLVAMARDTILRSATPFVKSLAAGVSLVPSDLVTFLQRGGGSRFSTSSLNSMARNIASSWTQSALLVGQRPKKRARFSPRPAAAVMVLLLGHLQGARGLQLFSSPWAEVFDGGVDALRHAAQLAGRAGYFRMNALGDVVDVSFPGWLHEHERRWVDEQDRPTA